jgi:soluble lytic murein transglycosylase-like protein
MRWVWILLAFSAAAQTTQRPPPPASPPPRVAAPAPLIDSAARAKDVEASLLRAMIERESAFRPCAISSKGVRGLMQLTPNTAGQLAVHDVFDPKENIETGARYLKQLIDKYKGDLELALGAYHAGPAARRPIRPQTRDYVDSILKKLAK